ncbi:MAG TPA: hypothetical protein VK843_16875 [Planctomycetota bacterium]|nr:hypothetical protein [Planctomycetota bacterium]
MPFAIDLLAGVEVLFSIGALGFLGIAAIARNAGQTTVPVLADIYPQFLRAPAPTALALLAGPPILVAIGLFLRKPWGRMAAIALHVSLGACSVWHFVVKFSAFRNQTSGLPEVTLMMLFLLALSIGVPLFLSRRHLRAAFARGHR